MTEDVNVVHRRLGHIHRKALEYAVKRGCLGKNSIISGSWKGCEDFLEHKATRIPHSRSVSSKCRYFGQIVNGDLSGRIEKSLNGNYCVSTMIDRLSSWVSVKFLKTKEPLGIIGGLQHFRTELRGRGSMDMGTFRSDNGGEYTAQTVRDYLKRHINCT